MGFGHGLHPPLQRPDFRGEVGLFLLPKVDPEPQEAAVDFLHGGMIGSRRVQTPGFFPQAFCTLLINFRVLPLVLLRQQRRNPQRRKVLTRSKAKRTPKVRRSRLPSPSRTGRLKRSSRMGSPALSNTPSPGAASRAMPSSIMLLRHSPRMQRPRRGRKT